MDHIGPRRLLEIADKDARLTPAEFEHIDKCSECVEAFAKYILQAARQRAQKKTKKEAAL
jgi:hypothetical protein